ncbi:MAG: PH domain-containing protein [Patescibacteria group bacterium]
MELQSNEQIIKIIYKPAIVYFLGILATLILILGACFFMVPLFRLVLWNQTWIGKTIFWFLIALGLLFGLRTLLNIYNNKLIITNQRVIIILRHGFFSQKVLKIDYKKIRNIGLSIQGLFPTIFGLGTLEFALIESPEIIKFSNITKANQIQELIIQLQASSQSPKNLDQLSNYELIEMARRIRDKLGRDVFRRLAEEGEETTFKEFEK